MFYHLKFTPRLSCDKRNYTYCTHDDRVITILSKNVTIVGLEYLHLHNLNSPSQPVHA